METNKLKHFITVYDTQNLRQAAELLNLSHSALSKSLKTLENELGYNLFLPEGRGIVSTKNAEQLYPKAKNVLAEIEKLNNLETRHEAKHTLKIATFEVFSTYFLQILKQDFSKYHLEMHELLQGNLEKAVAEGRVDFALTYEPIPYSGVEFLKVTEIKMFPYVQKGSFKNLSILDIPFAAPLKPVTGAPSGVKGLDGWPEHLFPRKIQFQVDMMESAMELTRQGQCAIFSPSFVIELHNSVVKSKFQLERREYPRGMKQIKKPVYIVKRKNVPESKEIKKVAKLLRRIIS